MFSFLFARMASRVMLATLAIPIPVSLSETEKHLELDEIAREKFRRLAGLLGLQTIPTRTSLINDMVRIIFLARIFTTFGFLRLAAFQVVVCV